MLIFVTLAALLLAALGLCALRTAPAVARWLALLSVVAFAVVGSLADRTEGRQVTSQFEQARLGGTASERRTAMLLAAARSGPMAYELELLWQAPSRSGSEATRALGAQAVAPIGLPFAPDDVRIRATTSLRVDRPTMLEIEVVGLAEDLPAELAVTDGFDAGYRETVTVGAQPTTVAFTPTRAGAWQVTLHIAVGEHDVRATGAFVVAEPDEVLVVDPSGVVAAALRAQGERVRESAVWPTDWREHDRIVLGRVLPVDQQQALARAVDDGTGLFVLAAAFGEEGTPLRELLPVRPLPVPPEVGNGEGQGAGAGDHANSDPANSADPGKPPPEPVKTDPAENKPPRQPDGVGDTEGAKPVSKDPIEVDRHSVAMVLVVDRSESMGAEVRDGLTKMSFAKASALGTAQALDEGDRVGVVSFGNRNEGRVELPMTDAM
ncbi:MAG TPA: VWA domain-containing protein, partial [Planctomycetes bacterium]|nr:VWA domain-containing protein [Planctomycetota bacterium]